MIECMDGAHKFATTHETVQNSTGEMRQGRYGLVKVYVTETISYLYCERCNETRPLSEGR